MRTSRLLSIGAILLTAMLFMQCEVQKGCTDPTATNYDVAADEDDGSCEYGTNVDDSNCESSLVGNLSITNETDEKLLLYKNSEYVQCISASSEDFIVNIPNSDLNTYKLQIWKASDVSDKDSPDISNVYRQWSVALSNTTQEEERANWLITDDDSYDGSGTLILSYPSTDEYGQEVIYQVDVYLNSKQGARIASLQPGSDSKKVSIDYGVHYLYFKYWYSDQDSDSDDVTELGWTEGSTVVINYEHQQAEVDIPVYSSNVGKYGEIKVINQTAKPISVYADDALIESITKVDGSTDGLSLIPASSSTIFLIPVDSYTITAKSLDGTTNVISFENIDILQNLVAIKTVGITHQEVSLSNNTSETLMLYSPDDEYLGAAMEAGEKTSILVPATLDSLVVYNATQTKTKKFIVSSETSISDLEDYETNEFSITSPWTEISSGYYQSPEISNKDTTTMSATLINYETVTFSFDYMVSSEANYDMFSLVIDGSNHLANLSGDIDWTHFSVELEAGTHTIQWIYRKDEMYSSGDDAVSIKDISID